MSHKRLKPAGAALLSFLIVLGAGNAFSSEKKKTMKLDFSQALDIMKRTNETIHAAKLEQKEKRYRKNAARGLYFPKIDLMATYTHLNEPIEMDFNPLKDAMIELSANAYAGAGGAGGASAFTAMANSNPDLADEHFIETIQDQDFWVTTISVRQPVFTGGKIIAANRAAEAAIKASDEKLRYAKSRLTTELVQRYFALRLSMMVTDVRKEVLEGMEKHLEQAKKMQESGMISNAERLHAEVSFAEAEREYQKSVRDTSTAESALKNTVSLSDEIDPVSGLFIAKDIESLAYYRKKARELNPVLRQLMAHKERAHQGYMKEIAAYSPDIFIFGSADVYNKNLSEYAPEWFVGAGATYTLFDGLSRYNKVKAARTTEEKMDATVKKAERDIDTLVEKSYNELMKDAEQIKALSKSIEFAEEYLRVRDKAFSAGFATSIDVVDARLNLSRVKIERLKAMYEFDISLARLLEVCGMSEKFEILRRSSLSESDSLSLRGKGKKS